VKLAKVYRSGLAKEVWQPDAKTREYREVFFAHRNAVKDAPAAATASTHSSTNIA
jgi:hypothetical protein